MIEKGFVRLLTPAEVNDMAQRIGVIRCSSCGASVDLRTDHACPHCRSAFSLLDPKAVERALEGYARATHVADAHITQERDHPKIQRDNKAHTDFDFDLFDLGLTLVWKILD
jgi:Zn finger protein HypA/HybF involved in hydrogenase expression